MLLVIGKHTIDLKMFAMDLVMVLQRDDRNQERSESGFGVEGVAPIGNLKTIDAWMGIVLFD